MASQLAKFHQRNHLLLPYESFHLREQYVYFAVAVGGGIRLLCRPNDLDEDEESKDHNVRGVLVHFPAL